MTNKTDAILDARRDLPDLVGNVEVRHLRLYIDDSETPALEVEEGSWRFCFSTSPWQKNIGLLGDDGWLFFEDKADGVIINRIQHWKKPVPSTYFKSKINAIGQKIKTLVAR